MNQVKIAGQNEYLVDKKYKAFLQNLTVGRGRAKMIIRRSLGSESELPSSQFTENEPYRGANLSRIRQLDLL